MATLEDLTPGALVRGVTAGADIEVVNVKWFGDSAVELTYKMPATGHAGTRLLYRDDELSLEIVEHELPWSFNGDGHLFRRHGAAPLLQGVTIRRCLCQALRSTVDLPHCVRGVPRPAIHEAPLCRQQFPFLKLHVEDPVRIGGRDVVARPVLSFGELLSRHT